MVVLLEKDDDPDRELGSRIAGVSRMDVVSAYARVLGDTFISTQPVDTINSYTANAVDEKNLMTGQALMTIVKAPAETEFLGVVTFRDPTKETAAIVLDSLQRLTRIGASTREWGRCQTTVEGYFLSDREMTSSYELGGKLPAGSKSLSDLQLENVKVDEAFKKVAEKCEEMVQGFADKKKTSARKTPADRKKSATKESEE
jgi:CRISPR type I-D-associated protein Csc2